MFINFEPIDDQLRNRYRHLLSTDYYNTRALNRIRGNLWAFIRGAKNDVQYTRSKECAEW